MLARTRTYPPHDGGAGEKLRIGTVGGSITAGQGSVDSPNWPRYLFDWLGDAYGADKVQGESSPH